MNDCIFQDVIEYFMNRIPEFTIRLDLVIFEIKVSLFLIPFCQIRD